jgi:hypothetical protein
MSMSSLQYDTGPSGFCELHSHRRRVGPPDSVLRLFVCLFVCLCPFSLSRFLPRLRWSVAARLQRRRRLQRALRRTLQRRRRRGGGEAEASACYLKTSTGRPVVILDQISTIFEPSPNFPRVCFTPYLRRGAAQRGDRPATLRVTCRVARAADRRRLHVATWKRA